MTGWFSMVCGMVLRCVGTLKTGLNLDQLQHIWQPNNMFGSYLTLVIDYPWYEEIVQSVFN